MKKRLDSTKKEVKEYLNAFFLYKKPQYERYTYSLYWYSLEMQGVKCYTALGKLLPETGNKREYLLSELKRTLINSLLEEIVSERREILDKIIGRI